MKAEIIRYSCDSCIPIVFVFSLLTWTSKSLFSEKSEKTRRSGDKKIVVNNPTWVLGTELGSYERAASTRN